MNATEPMLIRCSFCRSDVDERAIKCKHCGEFLRGWPGENRTAGNRFRMGERLGAAMISLFIPGLGQVCKGQIIPGLCWFFLVGLGYWCFIFPGLILHLACIAHAMGGNKG